MMTASKIKPACQNPPGHAKEVLKKYRKCLEYDTHKFLQPWMGQKKKSLESMGLKGFQII